jgi:hypothetical protein
MSAVPAMPVSVQDQDDDAAAVFLDSLTSLELRVIELCLSNLHEARPIVEAAGLEVRHFGHDDHRLIYAAWLVGASAGLPLVALLRLIRMALQDAGRWDPTVPRHVRGIWYSDATLARIACTPLDADEYARAIPGIGWSGDWIGFAIATAVTTLIDAAEAVEVWKL